MISSSVIPVAPSRFAFLRSNQRRKNPKKHKKTFSYRHHKPAANHPWSSGYKHVTNIEIKN